MDCLIDKFPEEDDTGNTEYKRHLINVPDKKFNTLTAQLSYRLQEGSGECFYNIGIEDDGHPFGLTEEELDQSMDTVYRMAKELNAAVTILSRKQVYDDGRYMTELLIRENNDVNFVDIKIAIAGSANHGKSSTLGVLVSGQLDNGSGQARSHILTHKHERDTGRSSSLGFHIIGYDSKGNMINKNDRIKNLSWKEIVKKSSKLISFIDLAGHEKYLRTTITGFSGSCPDYAMIVIGANMGITPMTREHIYLCLAFKIPFMVLLTKIDLCPYDDNGKQPKLDSTLNIIKKMAKSTGIRRTSQIIHTDDDIITSIKTISAFTNIPIFKISNKTGKGLDKVKKYLNLLPTRVRKDYIKASEEPVMLNIIEPFKVDGVGTVIHGFLSSGTINKNDKLMVGPDATGNFKNTTVKSIHLKRTLVESVNAGLHVCIAVKDIKKDYIIPGMVVLSDKSKPKICRIFDAEVRVATQHRVTIRKRYEPVIHMNNIRQVAKVLDIKNEDGNKIEFLKTNEISKIRIRFKLKPEYIEEGTRFVFRENNIRGVGMVTKVYDIHEKIKEFGIAT